jgi:GNAT superfamily N-acetyltransferase
MSKIRACREDEAGPILEIVNRAAEAYRGAIPAECWHEPYMSVAELEREIAAGVAFHGWDESGALVGVMGVQPVRDVDLIRHAYVLPSFQGCGIGSALLRQFRTDSDRPMLIGTWAAAEWAIAFYRRHGFRLVPADRAAVLLRTYWTIPELQARFSVVLADEPDQA